MFMCNRKIRLWWRDDCIIMGGLFCKNLGFLFRYSVAKKKIIVEKFRKWNLCESIAIYFSSSIWGSALQRLFPPSIGISKNRKQTKKKLTFFSIHTQTHTHHINCIIAIIINIITRVSCLDKWYVQL